MAVQSNFADNHQGALFRIVPETGTCGASIYGLDLRVEAPPEVREALVRALHEHGVLFIRFEGEITPDDHKRVAGVFGELRESLFTKGDIPSVSVIDSDVVVQYGTHQWHTDGAMLADPPGTALLRALQLPEFGGDTMWASMYAAYEALSPMMQRFLDGMVALHSNTHRSHPGAPMSAVHPVVIRDPVTGKPALYVNKGSTQRILGLSQQESDTLLRMLIDHVNTPDFHVRLKWDTQTIAVWEERVTQHRAIGDYSGRRLMHRVVTKGRAPEAYGEISPESEAAGVLSLSTAH